MVRHLLPALLSLLLTALWQNVYAAAFSVRLENNRVELGKYTNLILDSDRAAPSLRKIDLSALNQSFFVDASADITSQQHAQHWRLRLYPRHAGKLTVAPLKYQATSSKSLPLEATPAVDVKTGHQLLIQTSLSASNPWLNQQVLINFILVSKDRHVVLDSDSLKLPSGKLQLLSQTTTSAAKPGYFRHYIGWAYFPQQAGTQLLQLPPVYYKRDGVITHRFYLPVQKLAVRPLPIYVPSNFPVGNLMLKVARPANIFLTGRLHYINATLQAESMSQQQIPQLENYLHSQSGLQLYPATTHIHQSAGDKGLVSQIQLQIPIKATHSGLFNLDDIALQYFDPRSGKIRTLRYHWPTYVFISPLLLSILALLLILLAAYGLLHIVKFGRQRWRQYQYWSIARNKLVAASTPQEIKAAIMLMSMAEHGIGNSTLYRWHKDKDIDIEPLSLALYQHAQFDLEKLKQPYIQQCSKRLILTH